MPCTFVFQIIPINKTCPETAEDSIKRITPFFHQKVNVVRHQTPCIQLKPADFFKKLVETKEIPRTSQITPFEFGREFQKWLSAGQGVLCITMSSGVSGTYQSACSAAEDLDGDIIVIDSRQFCISLYVLIEYACRCRDQGMSLQETAEAVRSVMKRVHVASVFDTLEYLKLGGRLSSTAALAGSLLSIKPVITINEGIVEVISRARGGRKAHQMLVDFIRRTGGIDDTMPCCLGFTGFSDETLTDYIDNYAAEFKDRLSGLTVVPVGATVGTYAGPGAVAIAFFNK